MSFLNQTFTVVPDLLLNNYHALDLSSEAFTLIIFLLKQYQNHEEEINIKELKDQLQWEDQVFYNALQDLLQKKYLKTELKPTADGRQKDSYTLQPLFDLLNQAADGQYDFAEVKEEVESRTKSLLQHFESEFGRSLSPHEIETIKMWGNELGFEEDLILYALYQASLRNVKNIKYVQAILNNWEKENIQTVAEAEIKNQEFQSQFGHSSAQGDERELERYRNITIPLYHQKKDDV